MTSEMIREKTLIAAALGECVHVAGITNFLHLAEQAGWRTVFLAPAVPIAKILETAIRGGATMVGVSNRLTPETGERLLGDFAKAADDLQLNGVRFVLWETPPVVEQARALGFFDICFNDVETHDQVLAYLKGYEYKGHTRIDFPQKAIERIHWKSPYPLFRHHFGLPDFEATYKGIHRIADSQMIDVISMGVDQHAQENFFHPERQDAQSRGAGGVPICTLDGSYG
jgi:hypothetical protein